MAHRISGGTKVLALIADPVVQARAPSMVNGLLHQRDKFGEFVLLPMQVSVSALQHVVTGLRQIENFAGAIVSMPHKEAVVPLLDEVTPEAGLVGAVNVIRKNDDGRLVGTILDGEGFVGGLKSAGHEVEGAACLLAGAGGAASAIAFALARHGCASLRIVNRTRSKAAALAARVQAAFPEVRVAAGEVDDEVFDLAINGTPLGMQDNDPLPMPEATVASAVLVADCVVAPETTRLLQVASEYGCTVHTGMPMLAAQMDLMLEFMGVE